MVSLRLKKSKKNILSRSPPKPPPPEPQPRSQPHPQTQLQPKPQPQPQLQPPPHPQTQLQPKPQPQPQLQPPPQLTPQVNEDTVEQSTKDTTSRAPHKPASPEPQPQPRLQQPLQPYISPQRLTQATETNTTILSNQEEFHLELTDKTPSVKDKLLQHANAIGKEETLERQGVTYANDNNNNNDVDGKLPPPTSTIKSNRGIEEGRSDRHDDDRPLQPPHQQNDGGDDNDGVDGRDLHGGSTTPSLNNGNELPSMVDGGGVGVGPDGVTRKYNSDSKPVVEMDVDGFIAPQTTLSSSSSSPFEVETDAASTVETSNSVNNSAPSQNGSYIVYPGKVTETAPAPQTENSQYANGGENIMATLSRDSGGREQVVYSTVAANSNVNNVVNTSISPFCTVRSNHSLNETRQINYAQTTSNDIHQASIPALIPPQNIYREMDANVGHRSSGISSNNGSINNAIMLQNTQYTSQIMAPMQQLQNLQPQPLQIQHQQQQQQQDIYFTPITSFPPPQQPPQQPVSIIHHHQQQPQQQIQQQQIPQQQQPQQQIPQQQQLQQQIPQQPQPQQQMQQQQQPQQQIPQQQQPPHQIPQQHHQQQHPQQQIPQQHHQQQQVPQQQHQPQPQQQQQIPQQQQPQPLQPQPLSQQVSTHPHRRSMQLRLCEQSYEKDPDPNPRGNPSKFFSNILKRPILIDGVHISRTYRSPSLDIPSTVKSDDLHLDPPHTVTAVGGRRTVIDRGILMVSWYEGTTTVELKKHVRKSLVRKLRLGPKMTLENIRVIDESIQPCEEIVLSPYIPDGSSFLLKFVIRSEKVGKFFGAPDSPSAAPSPYPNSKDVGDLGREISNVLVSKSAKAKRRKSYASQYSLSPTNDSRKKEQLVSTPKIPSPESSSSQESGRSIEQYMDNDMLAERIESLFHEKLGDVEQYQQSVGKRQVVFTIANYFVLFLSVIAISAEVHNRAPDWIAWMDENVNSVQNCAADRDALFECISRGDMSGLVASVVLWATQSVATKPIFLFGFESPKKLWVVVYEAGVTAVCWGTSYMFIRRGLNPDTREHFVQKYWKDAVYGSLAGFNAAFMKAVLKNLIPQDHVLDAFEHPKLRIIELLSPFWRKSEKGIIAG